MVRTDDITTLMVRTDDITTPMVRTDDAGADDGVDEVEGRHGDGALLLLTFRVVTHRQLMKVTLRRLGTFWQPLTSHTKCIQ